MISHLENLVGKIFGHWTVLADSRRENNIHYWLCQCSCGIERAVNGLNLRRGISTSCGKCSRIGVESATFKHGKTHTDVHNIWLSMKDRCNNPNNAGYLRYGGRGIRVCDRWQNDFIAFETDMGPRPSSGHSIDRRDNDKGYSPENCQWATKLEQVRNRTVTLRDSDGKPISGISQETGVDYSTMHKRYVHGARGPELLKRRRGLANAVVNYRGQQMNLSDAIKAAGNIVRWHTARRRIVLGWTPEASVETPVTSEVRVKAAHRMWQTRRAIARRRADEALLEAAE